MSCNHDDCFTCPYPDCISQKDKNYVTKKKPGRKKMDPEVVHRHRLAYQKQYYAEHREELMKKNRQYYWDHLDELRDYQKRYRDKMLQRSRPLKTVWVTDGKQNRRVSAKRLEEYIEIGWRRGRTLHADD